MKNNQPLSEFATPAFRELIAAANPDVDGALSTSHHGGTRYLMRLYDDIRPRVARETLKALSEIHQFCRLRDKGRQARLSGYRCPLH